jgi:hypothetical protein
VDRRYSTELQCNISLNEGLECVELQCNIALEVAANYLGPLGYFLTRDPVLPNDCSLEKIMLNGGGV